MQHATDPIEPAGWPQWLDRNRYRLGLLVFGLFFLIFGWLVYTAGNRPLSAVEQASMAVIGVVVSAAFGIVLGIPFAARRIRIGSQLRRAHGISIALQNAQSDIGEAIARMRERNDSLDPEALAQFWEEVAINIRASLRSPILDAERIVEDWGELASGERDRIRLAERDRQEEVQALFQELETARSVKLDLEARDSPSQDLKAGITSVEQRILTLEENLKSRSEGYVAGTARALMTSGHYAKAVEAYDEILRDHPGVHTNYVGRAKARFLAGDREGALADLEKAQILKPDNPEIQKLRANFIAGEAPRLSTTSTREANAEHSSGNLELSLGNAARAEDHYNRAEIQGWNWIYSRINLAMSALVGGNSDTAAAEIGRIQPKAGSFIDLNTTALKAIVAIAKGDDASPFLDSLRALSGMLHTRDFSRSPLRYLQSGLRQSNPVLLQKVEAVFALLQSRDGAT
jgi:tetratricopeptide (TPR) repeat protein